ncbi:MAG: hypothetical protein QOD42_3378 [Sphingomonadales bacterium]|nr:hypothetical protein [Sphingomonadales bacterium]
MLIVLSLLLAAGQAAPAPRPPAVEHDITVIGQRLRSWTARYSVRGSRVSCRTRQSTGDREIDAIGCRAFETCIGQLGPRIDESDRADLDGSLRRRMKEAIRRDLRTCVDARRDALIADLADRRFGARAGG